MSRLTVALSALALLMSSCSSPSDDLGPWDAELARATRAVAFEGDGWTVQSGDG
jgi:hypothetical protein